MNERQLNSWEATALMVGAGVGAGIMAVPFLAQRVGLLGLAIILPLAWAASALIHLMLAEVLFRTGRNLQVVELMRLYVLGGRIGKWILWAFFTLLSVAFLANLAAYVSGAGEIVASLTGISRRVAELLIYVVSAGVVFFGLAGVSRAERFGAVLLAALVGVLAVAAIGVPFAAPLGPAGPPSAWLALYGMVMYAYWTFYSVPQVVKGVGTDHRAAVRRDLRGPGGQWRVDRDRQRRFAGYLHVVTGSRSSASPPGSDRGWELSARSWSSQRW